MHSIFGLYEPVSSLTHLTGAAVFAILAWVLLGRSRAHRGPTSFLALYSLTCVLLLCVSGFYHSLAPGENRSLMLRLDLAAIFALIAGTFTGVHGVFFTGLQRWGPLCVVWLCAGIGMVLSILFFDMMPAWAWLVMYLVLGWFGIFSGTMIWQRRGASHLILPLCAGLVYSLGAIFQTGSQTVFIAHVVGPHEMFHMAVLVGMGCFWLGIYRAVPINGRSRTPAAIEGVSLVTVPCGVRTRPSFAERG